MKKIEKIFIVIVVIIGISAVSGCGETKKKEKKAADTSSIWDEEPEEIEDTLFESPDLNWQELKGEVETVVVETGDFDDKTLHYVDTFKFDENGRATLINYGTMYTGENRVDDQRIKIKYADDGSMSKIEDAVNTDLRVNLTRNGNGEMEMIDYVMKSGGSSMREAYFWNGVGNLDRYENFGEDWKHIKTYKYDDQGRLNKMIEKLINGTKQALIMEDVEYVSFDDRGNWTERKIKGERSITDTPTDTPRKDRVSLTQKRKITYRQPSAAIKGEAK